MKRAVVIKRGKTPAVAFQVADVVHTDLLTTSGRMKMWSVNDPDVMNKSEGGHLAVWSDSSGIAEQ